MGLAQPSGRCKDHCIWYLYPAAIFLTLIVSIVIVVGVSHFVSFKTDGILTLAFMVLNICVIFGPVVIVCIFLEKEKAEAQIERNAEVVTAPTPQVMVSISPVKKNTQQTKTQIQRSNHSEPVTHSSVDVNFLVNTTVTVVPRTAEQEPKPDPCLKPGIATVATKKALPPVRSGEGKGDQN